MSFARLGADVPKDPMKMQFPKKWRTDLGFLTAADYVQSLVGRPGARLVVCIHEGNTGVRNLNFQTWEQFTDYLDDNHAVSI